MNFEVVIADKAYNSNRVLKTIHVHATPGGTLAEGVIPPKKNRASQRRYDRNLYQVRNLVKWFAGRFKQYRHIATRCEKTDRNDLVFWQLASTMVQLR